MILLFLRIHYKRNESAVLFQNHWITEGRNINTKLVNGHILFNGYILYDQTLIRRAVVDDIGKLDKQFISEKNVEMELHAPAGMRKGIPITELSIIY